MMVNEIKTTQDNVLSTLADIVKLRENISEEFLKKGDEIKEKEGKYIFYQIQMYTFSDKTNSKELAKQPLK